MGLVVVIDLSTSLVATVASEVICGTKDEAIEDAVVGGRAAVSFEVCVRLRLLIVSSLSWLSSWQVRLRPRDDVILKISHMVSIVPESPLVFRREISAMLLSYFLLYPLLLTSYGRHISRGLIDRSKGWGSRIQNIPNSSSPSNGI